VYVNEESIEQRVRRTLDATGIFHEIIAVAPELADTAAFCELAKEAA
jgi:hypothetical protein